MVTKQIWEKYLQVCIWLLFLSLICICISSLYCISSLLHFWVEKYWGKEKMVAFNISVIPILNGDSSYFNSVFTLPVQIRPSAVTARKEHEQALYRQTTLFSTRSPCLPTFASYLTSIFSFTINLNEDFCFKTGLCSLWPYNKFRENKGTLQAKPGMMLDNRSAELLLAKTI